MTRCSWLVVLVIAGCDAVEPWVAERPPPGPPFERIPCEATAECALFDELTSGDPAAGEVSHPDPRCADGLVEHTLAVSGDTRIDAASLACLELAVEVEEGEGPLVLALEGDTLSGAHVRVRSALRPVDVQLDLRRVQDVTIEGEGPVSLASTGVDLERTRIEVRASRVVATPVLRIDGGAHQDVAIALPNGALRLVGAEIARGRIEVEQLASQNASLAAATVRAEIADLIGVELVDATLDVAELSAGGGRWQGVEVARCDGLFLSRVEMSASRLAACEGAAVLDEVEAERSAFRGDVQGNLGYFVQSAFAGETVELRSRIHRSALCGVARIVARELLCVRCEPRAPPEVCGLVDGDTALCPDICRATCDDGSLLFGGAACRPGR